MTKLRKYGEGPFHIVVVHGGPGAGGEVAPVARELSSQYSILEPIQTETSLDAQIEELRMTLESEITSPAVIIGYSWGAWLGALTAAIHPRLVSKLILVGSGPFEESYVSKLQETRFSRLNAQERESYRACLLELGNPQSGKKNAALVRLGVLCSKTDNYDPLPWKELRTDAVKADAQIFQNVWKTAAELRRTGELMNRVRRVHCPVVAIHGEFDPHPAEGVREPLAAILREFQFILLEKCGHTPWLERQAKREFFRVLTKHVD